MHPEIFHIGSFTVYAYGTFIFAGALMAYIFIRKEWSKVGIGVEVVNEFFLYSIAAVFIGGKLFLFFERPDFYIHNMDSFFSSFGKGFVFYGSLLVCIPVLLCFFKSKKLDPAAQMDLIAICGALLHGIGKIGCFMAGCCYGKVAENAWYTFKFTDPRSAAQPLNEYLYATQLWDSVMIFGILFFMLYVRRRKQFHGQLFLLYAILYATGRYFTEIYRGDEVRGFVFNNALSHSQFISILIVIASSIIYIYRFNRYKIKNGITMINE